jgi:anti-sigma factor RsiW
MAIREITCRELVELVTEYLDGAMSVTDRLLFEQHVVMCGGCATYLEQMRETIARAGELREDDIPAPALDALLGAFRDWNGRR